MNNFLSRILCRLIGWALLDIAMNGVYHQLGYGGWQRYGMTLALGFSMIFLTARTEL